MEFYFFSKLFPKHLDVLMYLIFVSGSVGVVPEVQGTLEVVFYCERHEEEAIYKQALHAALGTHLESVSSDTRPAVHRASQ